MYSIYICGYGEVGGGPAAAAPHEHRRFYSISISRFDFCFPVFWRTEEKGQERGTGNGEKIKKNCCDKMFQGEIGRGCGNAGTVKFVQVYLGKATGYSM